MHFLVDFENVYSSGLRGCDMLLYTDRVTIFYSDAAPRVENGYIQQITYAGAKLTAIKLKMPGKKRWTSTSQHISKRFSARGMRDKRRSSATIFDRRCAFSGMTSVLNKLSGRSNGDGIAVYQLEEADSYIIIPREMYSRRSPYE